ncbi:MAG: DUF6335 family protein [Chloroflexi bacterium]|nr:DUF6335 family protein [Chloroflexota bacterium]
MLVKKGKRLLTWTPEPRPTCSTMLRKKCILREIGRYTDDPDIQESFAERQDMNAGQEELQARLEEHHATSPTLSGGDIDAAWEDADVGEESVGGMNPTPDQDMVEEIGEAFGITYAEDEPLRTGEKLAERDEHRWELDPRIRRIIPWERGQPVRPMRTACSPSQSKKEYPTHAYSRFFRCPWQPNRLRSCSGRYKTTIT